MPFNRPTLSELKARIQADMISRLELTGGIVRRSVVGVLSTVFAGCSHILHGHLDWISKQVLPDTAEGEYLEDHHARLYGITRKAAEKASGSLIFTGDAGAVVPAGTTVKRADGMLYITTEDGLASVPVTAQEAGSIGNTDAGAVMSLISPISGVKNSATVAAEGITNGSDAESDDELRERVLQRIQNPPMGGSDTDYIRWALEVPGVTRAWTFPLWMGLGTVGLTFVRDNDDDFIPDSAEVSAVQDYIDASRRPVTAEVVVFAPTPKTVDITMAVYPSTEAVKTAVNNELESFFLRESEPGATLHLSRLSEAISAALSEVHHTITLPAADVSCDPNEIISLGTVTFDEA